MRFSTTVLAVLTLSPAALPADTASPAQPVTQIRSTVRADSRGRLVRQFLAARRHAPPEVRARIDALIERLADKHEVDADLVRIVVGVESNFDPFAVSHKGAQGLMQLMPGTARDLGVGNAFDPAQNLDGGIRYLKDLLSLYKGDLDLALAAYNAGAGAVARYEGLPPYRETQDYVAKIRRKYDSTRVEQASAKASPEPTFRPVEQFVGPDGRIHLVTR